MKAYFLFYIYLIYDIILYRLIEVDKMEKKTIVITGSSDGIGAAAARKLKEMGHNVVIVGRSKEKTERIAKELDTSFHLVDYSDLSQVKRLAEELKQYDRIDVLVNNAGGAQGERKVTIDGYERTFQINHLSSFLLTNLSALFSGDIVNRYLNTE